MVYRLMGTRYDLTDTIIQLTQPHMCAVDELYAIPGHMLRVYHRMKIV